MIEIVQLIREFPWGAFFILLALISGIVTIITTFINRNKPPAPNKRCLLCEEDTDDGEVIASGSEVDDSSVKRPVKNKR